jgi:hypothetical protein
MMRESLKQADIYAIVQIKRDIQELIKKQIKNKMINPKLINKLFNDQNKSTQQLL